VRGRVLQNISLRRLREDAAQGTQLMAGGAGN
jgi:hypothetical protein